MEALDFTARKPKKMFATEAHALADEIWRGFNKQLPFPRIMAAIRDNGIVCVRECFSEATKAKHPDHLALFIFLLKKYRTTLK